MCSVIARDYYIRWTEFEMSDISLSIRHRRENNLATATTNKPHGLRRAWALGSVILTIADILSRTNRIRSRRTGKLRVVVVVGCRQQLAHAGQRHSTTYRQIEHRVVLAAPLQKFSPKCPAHSPRFHLRHPRGYPGGTSPHLV